MTVAVALAVALATRVAFPAQEFARLGLRAACIASRTLSRATHGLLVRDRARDGASTGQGRLAVDATTRRPLAGLRWYELVVPAATAGGLAQLGTNGP